MSAGWSVGAGDWPLPERGPAVIPEDELRHQAAAAQGPLAAIRVVLDLRGTGPTDGALLGRIAGILALTEQPGGAR